MRWRLLALVAAAALFATSASRAQSSSAEAAELFAQGRAALSSRDYETACAKLEASNRLERAVGTLISLAQCEEGRGRIASARAQWKEAADLASALNDPLNREAFARQRFDELDLRVPRLVLAPAPGAPQDLVISRDGVRLEAAAYGVPMAVDPGKHRIRVEARGHEPRDLEVDMVVGETRTVALEVGGAMGSSRERVVEPSGPGTGERTEQGDGRRTLAWIVGGIGVVGVGVGVGTGLVASSKWSSAKESCGLGCEPDSPAEEEKREAGTFATASTIAFIGGGALLAAGTVLWLTAPTGKKAVAVAPSIDGRTAALFLTGRF